ncbi:MAG: tetratricopeptide repeat protein [Armatimonadota bacterium]
MMNFENEIDQLLTQAEALLQDQQAEEALSLLNRVSVLEPNHAWAQLFRGVALGQLGRQDEAIEQLLFAADRHPEDIDIQVDVARHLAMLAQYQDAVVCASRATTIDGNDAGGRAVAAEALEHLGRIAEAVPEREMALALDPEDSDSRYYLAVDLCDLGRYADAWQVAEPLFEEYPDDPDIIRLQGACLSYREQHQQALSKWAELERLEGLSPNLLHNRASTLDALGLHEEALATINEAIAIEPETGINYYTRGMIHEHSGNPAPAVDDYLLALQYDPEHIDAAINLVEVAPSVKAVPQVYSRINTMLAKQPTNAKLLYVLGRVKMELGDLLGAQQTLEDAVCREPRLSIGWYTLSMLYTISGDPESALRAADRALQDFPDDPGIWLNRGQALEELRRYHEAMECYDRAVELEPEDGAPWFHLGRLLLLDLERPAGARGALKEALRLQPENDTLMWLLALCHMRLGQPDDAVREIRGLLSRYPDHPWGRVLRATWHAQRGDMDAAFADLRIATSQGYDVRLLFDEPLFKPLWSDPRFQATFSSLRGSRRDNVG